MDQIQITQIYNYPLKSSRGNSISKATVTKSGLQDDRVVALINTTNRIITGRELPKLLTLKSNIRNNRLILKAPGEEEKSLALPSAGKLEKIKLFRNNIYGVPFNREHNTVISNYVQGTYRLVYLDSNLISIPLKRGGQPGEIKNYSDSSPIHLINLRTLDYLNSRLDKKVSVRNFRPNFVIDGPQPFAEDSWKKLILNNVTYRVQEKTSRCVFTSIDPKKLYRDSQLEPLTTIAKIRAQNGARPTFGINLIPLSTGSVSLLDSLEVIEMNETKGKA